MQSLSNDRACKRYLEHWPVSGSYLGLVQEGAQEPGQALGWTPRVTGTGEDRNTWREGQTSSMDGVVTSWPGVLQCPLSVPHRISGCLRMARLSSILG